MLRILRIARSLIIDLGSCPNRIATLADDFAAISGFMADDYNEDLVSSINIMKDCPYINGLNGRTPKKWDRFLITNKLAGTVKLTIAFHVSDIL
jgi:hypothetical protein